MTWIDPSGFVAFSINEVTAARNIADILSSSIRVGSRILNAIDKVNDTISLIQSLQNAVRIVTNPSAFLPNLSVSDLAGLPDLEEAANSLHANSGRILSSIITLKIPRERQQTAKFLKAFTSVFAFYLPSVFPKGINMSSGLNIQKKPINLVTNRGGDRLFGMGMLLRSNNLSNSLQFFRMDYGAYNHTPGEDRTNHDNWQDGDFHYHIPKN